MARDLQVQFSRWVSDDNMIVQVALRMSKTLEELSVSFEDITPERRLFIVSASKSLVVDGSDLVKYATAMAQVCPDARLKKQIMVAVERIPNVCQQLRILMNVRMSSKEDTEHQVISSAMNLYEGVSNVLWACESAYVKIRAAKIEWNRRMTFTVAVYRNGVMDKGTGKSSKFLQELRAIK